MTAPAFLLVSCAAGLLALRPVVKWLEPLKLWQWAFVAIACGILGLTAALVIEAAVSMR